MSPSRPEAAGSRPNRWKSTRPCLRAGVDCSPTWDAPMTGSSPPEPRAVASLLRDDFAADWGSFMRTCQERVTATSTLQLRGKLTRVAGLVLEATGLRLAVGSSCVIEKSVERNVDRSDRD